jgi:hypothetical protein
LTWRGGEWHYLRLLAQSVGALRYKPGGVGSNHDGLMTYSLNVKAKSLITSALKTDYDFDSYVSV